MYAARARNRHCLDNETALAKLETMDISIDKWTPEQEAYAKAYAEGT